MKQFKVFLTSVLLLLIATISTNALALDSQDSVKAPTELTKEKIYEDVKGALSQLGGALKMGAEHVYIVLVKQQIVKSVTHLVVYIFFLGLGGALIFAGGRVKINADKKGKRADDGLLAWLYIPGIIMSIIGVVYFLWTIQSTVTGFVNPEYGAIEKILNIIHE